MAGIDKIYGTTKQYDQFITWCKYNGTAKRKKIKRYFYPRNGYVDNIRPITNLPTHIDRWLYYNCPIKWVITAIKKQYNIVD